MAVSLALVGTAHIHTPGFIETLLKRGDVRVAAVWDADPARAARDAEKLGAKAVPSPEAIWADPSIAAAVICSETFRHADLVLPGAAAGKHLFVEKPIGSTAAEAYRMAEAVEKAGIIFQTGFFQRGLRNHRTLKALVERGVFGTITRVRITNMHHGLFAGWFDQGWLWMTDPAQAGVGAFGDLGAHALDLLVWLFGPVERVTGLLNPVTRRYGEVDETGEALLKFRSGANGTLGAGWIDHGDPVTVQVSGTEGMAYIRERELFLNAKAVTGKEGFQPWSEFDAHLPHAFELFLDAVSGAKPAKELPLVTAREAAYGAAVMEAVYRGAAERKWIDIPAVTP